MLRTCALLAVGLAAAQGFAGPGAVPASRASHRAGASASCPSSSLSGLRMAGGDGAAAGGVSAKEAYIQRLKARQEEIARGENVGYSNSPELLNLVSDDPGMGLLANSDLQPEEVERLKALNMQKASMTNTQSALGLFGEDEDDAEAEAALLAMFAAQGDIDAAAAAREAAAASAAPTSQAPATGGGDKDTSAQPDFEAMYKRDMAKGTESGRKGGSMPAPAKVIELDTPLDSAASAALFKAMGKYEQLEKSVWSEVKQEASEGTLKVPERMKESFKLG